MTPFVDQVGIVFNIIAGFLMGIDFFLTENQINSANERLDKFIHDNFIYIEKNINKIMMVLMMLILIVGNIFYYPTYKVPGGDKSANNPLTLPHESSGSAYQGIVLVLIVFAILFILFEIILPRLLTSLYPKLEKLFLTTNRAIFRLLIFSKKGPIGSIGIICFILGNILQLWATFR